MRLDFHENHRLLYGAVLFGFVALTFIIAISPALWVQENTYPLPGSAEPTAGELRGLAIYVAEGCPFCHTQQVRPLEVDRLLGRPSAPGDYARLRPLDLWRMTPAVMGTERTGPDLSNLAARQPSDTWHYIHLYNPRSLVRASVMPAYPWLFSVKERPGTEDLPVPVPQAFVPGGGKVYTSKGARDLTAYLLSLRQVPVAGASAPGSAPAPSGPGNGRGATVYGTHCAGCHGTNGEGTAGVFPAMKGDPVVIARDPAPHVRIVLYGLSGVSVNGVHYAAAMPGHADELTDDEVAAVVNHERTSWGNSAPTVTAGDVARIRREGRR